MSSDNAKKLLIAQIGEEKAAQFAELNGNDYVRGHRKWLKDFIDEKIKPHHKMCDSSKGSIAHSLLDITTAIR